MTSLPTPRLRNSTRQTLTWTGGKQWPPAQSSGLEFDLPAARITHKSPSELRGVPSIYKWRNTSARKTWLIYLKPRHAKLILCDTKPLQHNMQTDCPTANWIWLFNYELLFVKSPFSWKKNMYFKSIFCMMK